MGSSDWTFTPYEKIAESLERLGLDEAQHRALARVSWSVTEKIHGANFVLVTDGQVVRAAKRRELLAAGEDFFGHRALLATLEEPSRAVFARVRGAERVAIHGELFGGAYPHPAVPPLPGVQSVQTGVWYSPRIEFAAFDVAVLSGGARRYLPLSEARAVLVESGVPFLEPLFVGRIEQALAFPIGFDSHVPAWLRLPPLPAGTNRAEGVVVKPTEHVAGRPAIKRKIREFAEDARFHEAKRPAPARAGTRELVAWLVERAGALANEARLHAAISKLGRPADARSRERLEETIAADVHESLESERARELAALDDAGRRELAARTRDFARELVELWFAVNG